MNLPEPQLVSVETELGPGRIFLQPASTPAAVLLLGHGAGGGVDAFDLELLARRLPPLGITVARFEQPWRTAGRKVAVRPAQLDVGWRAAVAALGSWYGRGSWDEGCSGSASEHAQPFAGAGSSLWFGGRSAGARVACRTAGGSVSGVVCLSFPLHPPGQPDRSRAAELLLPSVPRLVLQGTRDPFGSPAEITAAVEHDPGVTVVELPGADHGLRVNRRAPSAGTGLRELLVAETARFLLSRSGTRAATTGTGE